jgi:AraC family transcriptional regulator
MRAVEAFEKALGRAPVLATNAVGSGGISVYDWKIPWLDGFELPANDDFIVAYHSAGSKRVRAACNGPWSETTSIPGLTSVIPPGRRVEYRIDGQVSFSSIHIPAASLSDLLASQFNVAPVFRFAFDDPFTRSCIGILLEQARLSRLSNLPYIHVLTRALLQHLMEAFRADNASRVLDDGRGRNDGGAGLDAALDLIDSHLGDRLTLDELAACSGVSRAHFVRRFRAFTGLPPHQYLNLRRIEKAKLLLRQRNTCLAAIALEVGYSSQSHFAQAFRHATGQTPRQYRESPSPV